MNLPGRTLSTDASSNISPTRNTVPMPRSKNFMTRSNTTTSDTASLNTSRPKICSPTPISTPLDKFCKDVEAKGTAGGHWKLFSGMMNMECKEVSILMLEKKANIKAPTKIGRMNRLSLMDLLKYDVNQLQSLTHPRILRVMHPLEENKDAMAFASEAIDSTLDCIIIDYGLEKLEMKLGVLQLIDGLSYLHNSAKILHGNLTPAAVFVTSTRLWKIGGFQFSIAGKNTKEYHCYPWTKKLPPALQPDLDFLAPEYLVPGNQAVTTAADVFSLGVLICWIYAGGKRLIDAKNNLESYHIIVDQLDAALDLISVELGQNLKESLSKIVSKDVEHRPEVQLLALTKHFDDPALAMLKKLDDIAQEFDPAHKSIFLSKSLTQVLQNIAE
uniref:Protein kinase domain-containing protein n=1 Tax=Acrobeloides nanus TaxID=290746 RepID=A0A914CIE0_9BILA